jgi:NodT family efflux transporter outer membrane factor (OMF) lipoprotein
MIFLLALALAADPAVWWQSYGDAELNRIVERVAAANLDLKASTQRIAEARALTGERKGALGPQVGLTGGAQRLRGGFAQGIARIPNAPGVAPSGAFVSPFETGLFQGGLDMKWEMDLFGTNKAALAAARADVAVEEGRRADLLISLTAEAARNYVELRGLQQRLQITQENLATQRDLLGLTNSRARAGLDSQLDVERQALLVANTEAGVPPLEAEIALRRHRIAVLAGDFSFTIANGAATLTAPPAEKEIPAELVRRRPDVRAAEMRIAAAAQRVKQARSDLYPKIALNGLAGRQGTSLGGLSFGGGNFFNFGPQLQLPIFNFGRIRSNIAVNDARLQQEQTAVETEVLTALEEANNALVNYRQQKLREAKLAEAETAASSSLKLARDLQRAGVSDFLTVLDAQRGVLDARYQRSLAHTQTLVESVLLFKALAGGWPQ